MALKAGTVGVNPDILDNSGRVKEISAGEHDLSFEVDKATGKAGYKIDGGDYHPFEEAGVTLMGWVKPATLGHEGLGYGSGVTYVSGGYASDDNYVYVDIVVAVAAQIGVGGTILTMPDTLLSATTAALAGNSASASNHVQQYALSILQAKNIGAYPAAQPATQTLHIWGQYAKAQ